MKKKMALAAVLTVSGFAQANQTFAPDQAGVLVSELERAYRTHDCKTARRINKALVGHYVSVGQKPPLRVSWPIDVDNCSN